MQNSGITKALQSIRIRSVQNSGLSFKTGQIVTGKVEKFLPQNKAMIQMGGQKLIAQLEHFLQANKRYVFQVKQASPFVKLQVVSEKPVKNQQESAAILLKEMGMKGTRNQHTFLSFLLDHQLPVQKQVLSQAFGLLDRGSSFDESRMVLLEMLQRNLPMTKEVFDTTYARLFRPISISNAAEILTQSLPDEFSNETIQLRNILHLFHSGESNFSTRQLASYILSDIHKGSTQTFSLLKASGLIPGKMDFTSWKQEWTSWAEQNQIQLGRPFFNKQVVMKDSPLPFESMEEFYQGIRALWKSMKSTGNQDFQRALDFWLLQGAGSEKYAHVFTAAEKAAIKFRGFTSLLSSQPDLNSPGMSDTYKPLTELLQSVQQQVNGQKLKQPLQQLMQVFSGIQLLSNDYGEWTQFSVQFPGELFGLQEDFFMDFEGKKKDDDQLDSDYCRVMFYLQLHQLKETVMDMNIQNKQISLTIFNQNPSRIRPIAKLFEPVLKDNLSQLNFPLMSVQIKEFRHNTGFPGTNRLGSAYTQEKGLDIKI
ncbi:hypothetical protein GCM10008986_22780 [Salinibacillus aidingensis]|uniref:Hook-length control protein FliK n=1 Tax=Salinibacillus aidingensis TaxID=237684 RepID=A0ABN1BDG9_9BACI